MSTFSASQLLALKSNEAHLDVKAVQLVSRSLLIEWPHILSVVRLSLMICQYGKRCGDGDDEG